MQNCDCRLSEHEENTLLFYEKYNLQWNHVFVVTSQHGCEYCDNGENSQISNPYTTNEEHDSEFQMPIIIKQYTTHEEHDSEFQI